MNRQPTERGAIQAYRARWVLPMAGPPLADGVVCVAHGKLQRLGKAPPGVRVEDLGNVAILPALINAHAHLEFSSRSAPLPVANRSFVDWIAAVIAWRMEQDPSNPHHKQQAISRGMHELLATGTIAVGEIATVSAQLAEETADDQQLLNRVTTSYGHGSTQDLPLRGTLFHEWISFHPEQTQALLSAADRLASAGARSAGVTSNATGSWQSGLSPHAPYTTSVELVQQAIVRSQRWNWPIAMHLAESYEEWELLRCHGGDLWAFLVERGIWNPAAVPRGIGFRDYLTMLSAAARVLVVHGNYLDQDDWQVLARHAGHMTLVHCPRTHAFFERPRFPLRQLLDAGVQVALGTDSRASNPDLSLWREVQAAHVAHPEIPAQQLLAMVTTTAGRALGLDAHAGTLRVGGPADLVVISLEDGPPATTTVDVPHAQLLAPASYPVRAMYTGRWFGD